MPTSTPIYDVFTDLNPDQLNTVGMEVFKMWMDFALGRVPLQGRYLMHPTGKYAASLQYRRWGKSRVTIMTNDKLAPEARILELGHKPYDMKKNPRLMGRTFPMHRGLNVTGPVSAKRSKRIWARARSSQFNGFATVPTHITPENADSWIIPAMPAYSPAKILSELLDQAFGGKRGST